MNIRYAILIKGKNKKKCFIVASVATRLARISPIKIEEQEK